MFDDIDFERLRAYIAGNRAALESTLGPDGLKQFHDAVDKGEEAIRAWKDAEPRVWGRLISGVYRLLDWKAVLHHLLHALDGAGKAGETVLERGISRWEAKGKLTPEEATRLRLLIDSGEARGALRHLGVHVILSVAIAVPIPGLRSAARLSWTLAFWVGSQVRRFFRPTAKTANIHTPLVMAVSVLPMVGAVAYLAARPLRRRRLARLMIDQVASKLPFRLYDRLRLERRLAAPKR